MKVKIINRGHHDLPEYQTDGAAAFDLVANLDESVVLGSLERRLISTGLFIELPPGFEAQVRARSGLAINHGIGVLNSPGTIDSDYRGEYRVILVNLSDMPYTVNDGDRIAEVVIARYERVEWDLVDVIDETARGTGGFGHTGK